MHQSIPPFPRPPRATREHLFRFSVPGAGHLCTPGTTPRKFGTRGFKTVKSPAVKMRALFLRDGSFCGKRYGFHVTVASPRRTRQAYTLRFSELSFLILESFSVLYWKNYLSFIVYRKIKETYAANKKIRIQRTQSGHYNGSFCEF